jgi:hypothetical protein
MIREVVSVMALLTMQKKNLDSGSEVDVHGRI